MTTSSQISKKTMRKMARLLIKNYSVVVDLSNLVKALCEG